MVGAKRRIGKKFPLALKGNGRMSRVRTHRGKFSVKRGRVFYLRRQYAALILNFRDFTD
jgi:hypothetical protein